MFVGVSCFAQTTEGDINYSKPDTIRGDANGDGLEDYIVVKTKDPDHYVNLNFRIQDSSGKYNSFTKEWDAAYFLHEFEIENGYILILAGSGRNLFRYDEFIYKYIPHLNNWYLYGIIFAGANDDYSDFLGANPEPDPRLTDWELLMLNGEDMNSTLRMDKADLPVSIYRTKDADSIKSIFDTNYKIYLEEYKNKQFDKLKSYNMYETLDYLNYIEINVRSVQKYNDIAFFLLEAGRCQQARYILENIVYKFPRRTVAYLNLADAYFCLYERDSALKMYKKYIELMKASGKESKIPKRVFERIKE